MAAFGRRPPVDAARLSLAGIRNPSQNIESGHYNDQPKATVEDELSVNQ
jgi:hypothetical protein